MFGIVVRFEIHPHALDAFDRLMAATVAAIRDAEPGTLVYICSRVEGDPFARVFMELYADRAAFTAHERAPATMRFLTERDAYIAASRVELLEPYEWKVASPGSGGTGPDEPGPLGHEAKTR